MSLSLTLIGKYKNNKENSVGAHCPVNNRFFNNEEKKHLENMINQHLKPNQGKFKYIKIHMTNDGFLFYQGKCNTDFLSNNTKLIVDELFNQFKLYNIGGQNDL